MLEGLDDLLTKVVRVSGYQLVMIEDSSRKFTVLQEYPEQATPYVPMIGLDSPLLNYFRLTGAEQLALNLPSENRHRPTRRSEARACLAEAGVEFCFPFMVSAEPFGMLFLKERTEGKRYTATDIQSAGDAGTEPESGAEPNSSQKSDFTGSGIRTAWKDVTRHGA